MADTTMTSGGTPPCMYLDNNGSTFMPPSIVDTMIHWINQGDPSAPHALARKARKHLEEFRDYIADTCDFKRGEDLQDYQVIFTSGASESNCFIVTSAARAYAAKTGKLPHIITSNIEHDSLLRCCELLKQQRMAQLTVVAARTREPGFGTIDPGSVEEAIRPNTCLITVIAAHHKTGALNDLGEIGQIAHRASIPLHSDAAQLFGRSVVRPGRLNVDALSASFHKLHGPPGVGLLLVKNSLIRGYHLGPQICGGNQNGGLRGGTENLPGIAASYAAMKLALADRGAKNQKMQRLRDAIRGTLEKHCCCLTLEAWREEQQAPRAGADAKSHRLVIVWLMPQRPELVLPNVLLFAVVQRGNPDRYCSRAVQAALEKRNVMVGLVSYETAGLPAGGDAIRVSLADETTRADATRLVSTLLGVVASGDDLATMATNRKER